MRSRREARKRKDAEFDVWDDACNRASVTRPGVIRNDPPLDPSVSDSTTRSCRDASFVT